MSETTEIGQVQLFKILEEIRKFGIQLKNQGHHEKASLMFSMYVIFSLAPEAYLTDLAWQLARDSKGMTDALQNKQPTFVN